MRTKPLVVGVLALVLVGIAGAFVAGVGPAPGGDSGDDVESFPTETSTATPTDGGTTASETTASGTTATAPSTPPFAFTVDGVEECGRTCRDVTSTVTNQQDTTAEDVTVYTRIYVGRGTDGDVVWQGRETVGTLDAGESYTATRRVELSYSEAIAVQGNDGWVTIQTTVQTNDRTVTYTDQRQVA